MSSIGRVCTLVVLVGAVWVYVNWRTVKTAWRYREQIRAAADAGAALEDLGVLR